MRGRCNSASFYLTMRYTYILFRFILYYIIPNACTDIVWSSTLSSWFGGRAFLRDAWPVFTIVMLAIRILYTRCIEGKLMWSIRSGTRRRNIILRKFWAKVMLVRGAWRKWWTASPLVLLTSIHVEFEISPRARERRKMYPIGGSIHVGACTCASFHWQLENGDVSSWPKRFWIQNCCDSNNERSSVTYP